MNRLFALVLMLCGVAVAQDASLYITNDSKGGGFAMLAADADSLRRQGRTGVR